MVDVRTVFDQQLQNACVTFKGRYLQDRAAILLEYQEAQESIKRVNTIADTCRHPPSIGAVRKHRCFTTTLAARSHYHHTFPSSSVCAPGICN